MEEVLNSVFLLLEDGKICLQKMCQCRKQFILSRKHTTHDKSTRGKLFIGLVKKVILEGPLNE